MPAPLPTSDPSPPIAAPVACGAGYVPNAQGKCSPLNAKTGRRYSEAELARTEVARRRFIGPFASALTAASGGLLGRDHLVGVRAEL